jgi:crotonobetainyl-CoA:carnitine CoA-transferase CaiB-like acyl-CoA transferase
MTDASALTVLDLPRFARCARLARPGRLRRGVIQSRAPPAIRSAATAFPLWGRGKKSVVLSCAATRTAAPCGASRAVDVLLETFRPGVAERLGLAYEDFAPAHPALVHTSITGFGRRGPYTRLKGYEAS